MSDAYIHMTVITETGPKLKCGKKRVPGVRMTDIKGEVSCPKCK